MPVSGDDGPGFRLHLRQLFVAVALKDAVRRAEEHEAAGQRRRARRARREAARLTLRLEELGGSLPAASDVGERILDYVSPRPQRRSSAPSIRRIGESRSRAGDARLRDGDEGTSTNDRSITRSACGLSARARSINC